MNLLAVIIAVICIVGLAAIAMPSIQQLQQIGTQLELRTIAQAMVLSSMQAMAVGKPILLRFEQSQYSATQPAPQYLRTLSYDAPATTYKDNTVTCYPDGSIAAGTIYFSTKKQQRYCIAVEVTPLAPLRLYRQEQDKWTELS
ncbi:hypothetical protein M1466_04045 [Candidatus Dependentiae bacterium]|nr:hypothetical protein [Candidatus Dependentiae bacterium]